MKDALERERYRLLDPEFRSTEHVRERRGHAKTVAATIRQTEAATAIVPAGILITGPAEQLWNAAYDVLQQLADELNRAVTSLWEEASNMDVRVAMNELDRWTTILETIDQQRDRE